jgi:hypothetical protein
MAPAARTTTGKGTANTARARNAATASATSARWAEGALAYTDDGLHDDGQHRGGKPGETAVTAVLVPKAT